MKWLTRAKLVEFIGFSLTEGLPHSP